MSEKRDVELFLVDVLLTIEKIKIFTKDFSDVNTLLHDELHWDATIRQFEIMGEAFNNLLKEEKFKAASPYYFRKIVNFRNVISHAYFGIAHEEVWDIIHNKLNTLHDDLEAVIKKNFNISEAIESEALKHPSLSEYFNELKEQYSARQPLQPSL